MERSKRKDLVVKLCVTAVMAALVAGSSKLQIQVPSIVGTSRFHLGNTMCALSGLLLGPWWGGLASGLGSIIFDLTDPIRIAEVPITFVTKGLYGLIAGLVFWKGFKGRSNYGGELVATLCAAVSYIVLYSAKTYFYNGLLLSGLTAQTAWAAVVAKLPASLFNAVVAVVFAPILGVALNRGLKAAHLDRLLD